jgi:phosphoglycerate dehydrogenase-like enzyme
VTGNSPAPSPPIEVLFVGSTAAPAAPRIQEHADISIAATTFEDPIDEEELAHAAADADAVVGRLPIDASENESIRLVQSLGADVERFDRERFPPAAFLCNVYGHGPAVAEHAIMLIMALQRDLREVVLTVPFTDATDGLIGEREFEKMDDDAVLVNVARGPVVEEQALYDALEGGEIAGAGIDTWYQYPEAGGETVAPSSEPLAELDTVRMTPHVAGWTDGTTSHRWQQIATHVSQLAAGTRPDNVVWEPRTGN